MSIKRFEYCGFDITWIKKKGMKNVYLQVKTDGIFIKSNLVYSEKNVQNLISTKQEWIKKHLCQNERKYYYLGQIVQNTSQITKENAQTLMRVIIEDMCKKHDLSPNTIRYKYVKSIWGSCSSKNNINLNINLLQTPIECIEYVIAHELAHIKVKNHSISFWEEVRKILPDYKKRKMRLREYEKKILKVTRTRS